MSTKHNLLGVLVDATNYQDAVDRIIHAAIDGVGFAATALAVHGLMTGWAESEYRYRLNHLDLVTPDGQPVRWALNSQYGLKLSDRVYGPRLMLLICDAAARHNLPVYFYGSRRTVLIRLIENIRNRFPGLIIAGSEESKFRTVTPAEKVAIANRIKASGAKITFVGMGCPRQETFAYEYRDALCMPVVAIGAAFDYHAGLLSEPPVFMQESGMQWLYRLIQEPRRLWKRYLVLNSEFVCLFVLQRLGLWIPDPFTATPPSREVRHG